MRSLPYVLYLPTLGASLPFGHVVQSRLVCSQDFGLGTVVSQRAHSLAEKKAFDNPLLVVST